MRRKAEVYLWEIREHAQIILSFTHGKALAEYSSETMLRLAVEREFTILGEAMVRLRKEFPIDYHLITDATLLVRFRNRLVHLYDLMRDEEVWEMITSTLPAMILQLDSMIVGLEG